MRDAACIPQRSASKGHSGSKHETSSGTQPARRAASVSAAAPALLMQPLMQVAIFSIPFGAPLVLMAAILRPGSALHPPTEDEAGQAAEEGQTQSPHPCINTLNPRKPKPLTMNPEPADPRNPGGGGGGKRGSIPSARLLEMRRACGVKTTPPAAQRARADCTPARHPRSAAPPPASPRSLAAAVRTGSWLRGRSERCSRRRRAGLGSRDLGQGGALAA